MNACKRHLVIDALNLSYGGGVVVMERLAKAFDSNGYLVSIFVARELPGVDFEGTNVKTYLYPKAKGAVGSIIFRFLNFNRLVGEIGGDMVLSFNYFTPCRFPQVTYHINVIPFLKYKLRRKSVGFFKGFVQGLMANQALRKSTVNIFESKYVKDQALKKYPAAGPLGIAYIGTDYDADRLNFDQKNINGPYVSITSGAEHKRNELSVEFFRRVFKLNSNARLDFIGNESAIRKSLSNVDLDFVDGCSAINFKGYLDRVSLLNYLKEARALIVFSELESFYMVALEAMSSGCPVLISDSSSARESVGESGIIFPEGDVGAAIQADKVLNDVTMFLAYQQAGFDWAGKFNGSCCAKSFVTEFEKLLDGSGE